MLSYNEKTLGIDDFHFHGRLRCDDDAETKKGIEQTQNFFFD